MKFLIRFFCLLACLAWFIHCDVRVYDTSSHSNKMTEMERAILQLQSQMSAQEDRQAMMQQRIVEQDEILRQQDTEIRYLKEKLLLQEKTISIFHQSTSAQQQVFSDTIVLNGFDEINDETQAMHQHVKKANNTSEVSDEIAALTSSQQSQGSRWRRSDDSGPLEIVVQRMQQQLTQVQADVQSLRNSDTQQIQALQNAQTSTYVHWGSASCGAGSQLIYSGNVASTGVNQTTGVPTHFSCLVSSPVYTQHHLPTLHARVIGVEYETGDSYQDQDAVCAVCRASMPNTIMIPGTNVCAPGWTPQYNGFLMGGPDNNSAASEFLCVDSKMESRAGSQANTNTYCVLGFTVSDCSALPCGPYVQDKPMTCVVCSA